MEGQQQGIALSRLSRTAVASDDEMLPSHASDPSPANRSLEALSNSSSGRNGTNKAVSVLSGATSSTDGQVSGKDGYASRQLARIAQRQGYQPAFSKIRLVRSAGLLTVVPFVILAVLDGEYSGWNFEAYGGLGGLLVSFALVVVMFACYLLSLGELASVFPFAGGSYGYVRGTMGKIPGLLVLLFDIGEYLIGASATTITSGTLLAQLFFGDTPLYAPLWSFVYTVLTILLLVFGGARVYQSMAFLSIFAIGFLLVYIFGGFHFIDFYNQALFSVEQLDYYDSGSSYYAANLTSANLTSASAAASAQSMLPSLYDLWFPRGAVGVFSNLPFAVWWFVGLEIAPFLSEDVHTPSRSVPRAMLLSGGIITVLAILTLFVCVSIAPGIAGVVTAALPLSPGFALIFNTMDSRALAVIQMAAFFTGAVTFLFAGIRVLFAAGRAGFLPPFLCAVVGRSDVPAVAIVVGAFISYVCVLIAALPQDATPSAVLVSMTVLFAMLSLVFKMIAFVVLRIKFPREELARPFYSPLGIPAAVVATIIAIMCIVCTFIYQGSSLDSVYVLIGLIVWTIIGSVYYAFVGRHALYLSPEENAAVRLQYRENLQFADRRVATEARKSAINTPLPTEFFRLNAVFQDVATMQRFENFLKGMFCQENLLFHIEVVYVVQLYRALEIDESEFRQKCMAIYNTYMAKGARLEINSTAETNAKVLALLLDDNNPVPVDVFDVADREILTLLHADCLRKFEESEKMEDTDRNQMISFA